MAETAAPDTALCDYHELQDGPSVPCARCARPVERSLSAAHLFLGLTGKPGKEQRCDRCLRLQHGDDPYVLPFWAPGEREEVFGA